MAAAENHKALVTVLVEHNVDINALTEKGELWVGSKVEVRYKGKAKYYSGVIARKRRNGTFDINYDDGEDETGVDKDLIRSLNMVRLPFCRSVSLSSYLNRILYS